MTELHPVLSTCARNDIRQPASVAPTKSLSEARLFVFVVFLNHPVTKSQLASQITLTLLMCASLTSVSRPRRRRDLLRPRCYHGRCRIRSHRRSPLAGLDDVCLSLLRTRMIQTAMRRWETGYLNICESVTFLTRNHPSRLSTHSTSTSVFFTNARNLSTEITGRSSVRAIFRPHTWCNISPQLRL